MTEFAALAFFDDPNSPIDDLPRDDVRARHLGATTAVLKYAPRRLRPDAAEDAKAQAALAYWRERAFKAETRLRALETRVRQLAAKAQRL